MGVRVERAGGTRAHDVAAKDQTTIIRTRKCPDVAASRGPVHVFSSSGLEGGALEADATDPNARHICVSDEPMKVFPASGLNLGAQTTSGSAAFREPPIMTRTSDVGGSDVWKNMLWEPEPMFQMYGAAANLNGSIVGASGLQANTRWDQDMHQLAFEHYPDSWPLHYDSGYWTEEVTQARETQHLSKHDAARGTPQATPRSSISESTSAGGSGESASSCSDEIGGAPASKQTMVIMRGIPNTCTRNTLIELLNAHGFAGCYDFVYLPIDFQTATACGYAFVNLFTHNAAERLCGHFERFNGWIKNLPMISVKFVDGPQANVDRYRNIPAQHKSVPDEFKPVMFNKLGERIPFPVPTKEIPAPRFKILAAMSPASLV